MRVPILSACSAALTLAALPAAAHGWSSSQETYSGAVERNCPIVQPSHGLGHHHALRAGGHRYAHGGGCPVARDEPGHYQYQRVFTRDEHDWSHEDQGSWRRDRRAWADGDWSGRMGDRDGLGCHDANGPDAYRDGDGGHRAARDRGMRCHDGGMQREQAYAQSGGVFGYRREAESGWSSSSSEHHGGWDAEGGRAWGRPSMTDRYGFLTWPGKTHFLRGQPIEATPDIGPQAPPEESWEVHP
jgi:hypothetical protein